MRMISERGGEDETGSGPGHGPLQEETPYLKIENHRE
jgi:hypothetical protein